MSIATANKKLSKSQSGSVRKRQKRNNDYITAASRFPRKIGAEELPWRQVSPTQLDDYEGFFGLEEVEGVSVMRDEHTGQLTYGDHLRRPGKRAASAQSTCVVHEDEWRGFSDSDSDSETPAPKNDIDNLHQNPLDVLSEQNSHDAQVDIRSWREVKDLSHDTLSALSSIGFCKPTAIQAATIPKIMNGIDIVGKAPTGSGKTLAFGIPILEKWMAERRQQSPGSSASASPVALIIEPARELAHQITTHLMRPNVKVAGLSPRIVTLTGGLSSQKQTRLLAHADIVVATPGRLWDHMSEDMAALQSLRAIRFLVIDEADRLLSQGHYDELEKIFSALHRRDEDEERDDSISERRSGHQTLVFSATFARELQHNLGKITRHSTHQSHDSIGYLLQRLNFRHTPEFVDVSPNAQIASNLTEALLEISDTNKDLYLYALLLLFQPHESIRALVFVNSISAVRRITRFLQLLGFNAVPLHSNMEQKARLKSVERFTNGQAQRIPTDKPGSPSHSSSSVLVATDVAARGLDVPDVHVVIHYHLPRAADMYIHRSGRTARASAEGASILIAGANEAAGVKRLISQVHAQKNKTRARELRVASIEDRIVSQLRPRAQLAKKIADVEQAKDKGNGGDQLFQQAAEDLGVDSDDVQEFTEGQNARGRKKRQKQSDALQISKGQLKGAKMELRNMLMQRLRLGGVSERYLANGRVDVSALIQEKREGRESSLFLGNVEGLKLL